MTIGERIRTRRVELGYTQEEVAKKLGYKSRSSFNKIENARSIPLKKVEKVASILEISPSALMGWDDNPVYLRASSDAELLNSFNKLTPENQMAVITMINSLLASQKTL